MATKVKTGVIDSGAITSALITDASITADDLHTTLDLTGKTVTVATASASDNDTSVASTAYVTTAIANLADSAPSTLNTLNELAAALGDDANFSTTVTNSIATKLPLAGGTMTGALTSNSLIKTTADLEVASSQPRILLDRSDGAYSWNIYNGDGSGNFPQSTFNIANNAGNAVLTATDVGNVGIGITNPLQTFEIHNSDTSDYTDFGLRGTGHKYVIGVGNDSVAAVNDKFYLYDNDNSAFRMVVNAGGNVGIGTTDPTGKLHVSGGRAGVISTSSSWGQFRVGNTSTAEVGIAYVTGATESDFLNDGDPACAYKVIMGINPYGAGTTNFGIGNDTILNYHTIWTEAGHQLPRVDNTYDLGSSTKGFKNIYLSSDLSVGGHIIGDDDASYMRINASPNGGGAIYFNGPNRTNYQNHIQYLADVHNFGDVDGNPINTLQVVSDSELVTINGKLNVTKPIQTTTDSGTRMYTGLATGSQYYSVGFLILDTNIPDPGQGTGANMFSIHINGFSYNDANGGIIDLKIGAYSGEGYFHNASYTGSNIPDRWVNNVRFARKTSTNTVSIILGDSTTPQPVEVAATLFIQGFGSTNTSYAEGWDWKVSSNTTGYTSLDKVNEKSTKRPSFSAGSSGFSVSTGWQVISDSMSQITDGPDDNYEPSNGRFTPQLPGWYQFNFGGWATYNSSTGAERYAVAFAKNGSLTYLSGGNYCATDSPLGGSSQRVYLNGSSDYVELKAYSSVATTWGGGSHYVWWDGYWTGS